MKICGEKGLAGKQGSAEETSVVRRDGKREQTKLAILTCKARENPKIRFTTLIHLLNEEFLGESFAALKRDKAAGLDGITVEEYERNLAENLKGLVERMKTWQYRPQPARRVEIPKGDGKMRPLGIPTVEDKVVQMGVKRILEAIYEVDFLGVSYGFRPGRSCHQAVDALDAAVMRKPTNYVADIDIERFFDTVDHKRLMELLRKRIADSNMLRLIGRFLRAGYVEAGRYYQPGEGTPQGGVLSPLLANIYLHYVLDEWFEERFRKQAQAYSELIRYADDVVAVFQKKLDAIRFNEEVRKRMAEYGLRLSEEKSRLLPFGRYPYRDKESRGKKLGTFDFLGFTFYCTKSRKGSFMVGRRTAKKKFRQKLLGINQWLKKVRSAAPQKEWWGVLGQKLEGHYRYYGISGNMQEMKRYYGKVLMATYKWLNRRSQKKRYPWRRLSRYLQCYPLPKPRIYHRYAGAYAGMFT